MEYYYCYDDDYEVLFYFVTLLSLSFHIIIMPRSKGKAKFLSNSKSMSKRILLVYMDFNLGSYKNNIQRWNMRMQMVM